MFGYLNSRVTERARHIIIMLMILMLAGLAAAGGAFAQADWYRFQNSDENNGVTSVEMPGSYNEASLKWGKQLVEGYSISFTPPLIIDGYLYTASKERIYKIDKETGDIRAESDEMLINVSFAMHPMTYAEDIGCLFVPLLDGRIQCVNADDLSLKWISKTYTGAQALSPVTYKDGRVYTGIWNSEITDGVYFCLDAKTGNTIWEFRPSEQKQETVARALATFPVPTGMSKPDNYYTYTAIIKVKPKSGYKFALDSHQKYWLYTSDGNKVIPAGAKESDMVQSTVNGYSAKYDYNSDGSASIRVRFNYYNGQFTQTGSDGSQSSVVITGLSTPETGATLDKNAVTDSNVTIESIEWMTGDVPHGFYWAGPYVNDDYVIFGSDDGQNNLFAEAGSDTYTSTSVLYSLDRMTGSVIDKIDNLEGDIRSTVVHSDGYIYFTTKGGRLYKVKLLSDGKFDRSTLSSYKMNGMMTASPVVHGGRIYVGVSGTGGQFNADGGHLFAVLRDDDKLSGTYSKDGVGTGSLIYTTQIAGYPQASPLLSTGGDGKSRLYFTFNAFPGGIYYLEDSSASTSTSHANAAVLFKPERAMRQYCISPLAVDGDGTIYYKNDSGYLMAIAVNKAYLPSFDPEKNIYGIKVTSGDKELEWNEPFEAGTLNYTLTAPNGSEKADVTLDLPDGMTALVNGEEYKGKAISVDISENSSAVAVTVRKSMLGKLYTRTYTLNMSALNNNANLAGLVINATNTAPSYIVDYGDKHTNTVGIGFDPVFEAGTQKYVSRTYTGDRRFLNVWVQAEDSGALIKAYPVDSVGNDLANTNADGSLKSLSSNGKLRFPIYWVKGKISAEIKIVVTPPSGNTEANKEYNIELVRSEDHLDVGNDVLTLSVSSAKLYTSGGNRTVKVDAFYGDNNVTDDCTWYSSKPEIATVDSEGNVAAQNKEGDAIIWASYGAQNTEDRPLAVQVRNAVCADPEASLVPGKYDSVRSIQLTTSTEGADIYYTLGEGTQSVAKPTKASTRYTGSIKLGESGRQRRYRIRAIAVKDGFASSQVADFDYTIDCRARIHEVTLADFDAPEEGKPLDTEVKASEDVTAESIRWYKVTNETAEEVAGNAEEGAGYKAEITLMPKDPEGTAFDDSPLVRLDGKALAFEHGADGRIIVSLEYPAEVSTDVNKIVLTGIRYPKPGQQFESIVYSKTDGVTILGSSWSPADGEKAPDAAGYNTEYIFTVNIAPAEGYEFAEDITVEAEKDGQVETAETVRRDDGTYDVKLSYRTAKLKVDTSDGSGLSVTPEKLDDFANRTSINDIRAELKSKTKVTVKTEDGNAIEIDQDDVYWDEEVIKSHYDPEALNAATFKASGKVTLPDYIDANGSSLTVSVSVNVLQGEVAVPMMTPEAGEYKGEQTITFSCPTKGAVIYFTRSDMDGRFTYEEPIILSGEEGKKTSYKFSMYASVNGLESDTVTYTITIDRTSGGTDDGSESGDKDSDGQGMDGKTTPSEEEAKNARVASEIGKIKISSSAGNARKKTLMLSFKPASGAVNYRVEYRKAGKNSKWLYVWTSGKTKVTIGKLKKNSMYEVRIAAFRNSGGTWQRGGWSGSLYQYMQTTTVKYKARKKALTARVKKVRKVNGYKVKYSLKKNMKGAKVKTFKGWKKTNLKVKKLKAGKKYFVQVCPYKKYKGKEYVGVWTKAKKVKVK